MARGLSAVLLLPLLALAGCASHPPQVVAGPHTYAVVDGPQTVSGAAGIEGTLMLDAHGCWGIGGEDGTVAHIIWPDGTSIGDDDRITIAGIADSLTVGAVVNGGGGGGPASEDQLPCWTKGEPVSFLTGAGLGEG